MTRCATIAIGAAIGLAGLTDGAAAQDFFFPWQQTPDTSERRPPPPSRFFRQTDQKVVLFQQTATSFCRVQNDDQLAVLGGVRRVRVARQVRLAGQDIGACAWPNGLYRLSDQPQVYQLHGTGPRKTGAMACQLSAQAKPSGAVRVVAATSDLSSGRGAVAPCAPAEPVTTASAPAFDFDPIVARKEVQGRFKQRVTCVYYGDLMVRHEDVSPEAGSGDPKVSIVPGANPTCGDGRSAGEYAVPATTPFLGRKGRVFIFADRYRINIFDNASRRVVHSGTAFRAQGVLRGIDNWASTMAFSNGVLQVTYRHEVSEGCSLMQDAQACWSKMVGTRLIPTELAAQPPDDCATAYKAPHAQPGNPSAVGFIRTVRIDAAARVQMAASGPLLCRSQ